MGLFTSRNDQLRKAEHELFTSSFAWWRNWQTRHGLPKPAEPTTFKQGDAAGVHHVSCTAVGADPKGTPLVLLHGYAHGTSCFHAVLAPLAESWGGPVYALDTPGCGLSHRPPYQHHDDPEQRRLAAEAFFCDGIDAWRAAMGIERMVLAGHSIGGHIAFVYTERHPAAVERLVLLSPAGVPHPPEDEQGIPKRFKNAPFVFRAAFSLWERGYNPLSVVRAGAGWGPGRFLINRYVNSRMNGHSWSDPDKYAEYMYSNHVAGEGSWGAAAITTLLRPGAHAVAPLCDRFEGLDWHTGPRRVAFVYGERDWMDASAAEAVRDRLPREACRDRKKSGRRSPRSASPLGPGRVEVCRVSGAGHNLPTDNPLGVVEAVLKSARAGALDGRVVGKDAARREKAWLEELRRATFVLEKQDPCFPYTWRTRHFAIDAERGALTWTADEAHPLEMIAADQKSFRGAVPLEMITAVTPSEAGVSVEIADRTFVLRPPKDAAPEARDAFVLALRKAVASHPSNGPVQEDTLPRSHWKDAERYRERQRMTRVVALAA